MTRKEIEVRLAEIGEEYQDAEITIGNDIFHIYYIFEAGQIGWEKYFDSFSDSQKNFEKAKEHLKMVMPSKEEYKQRMDRVYKLLCE